MRRRGAGLALAIGALLTVAATPEAGASTAAAPEPGPPVAVDRAERTVSPRLPYPWTSIVARPIPPIVGTGPRGRTEPITVQVPDLRAKADGLDQESSCWYRSGLVMGPAEVDFQGPELQKLSVDQLLERGYGDSAKELPGLLRDVSVYAIPPDVDPLQAALSMGNGASPVLMAGYVGHWAFAPGADPHDGIRVGTVPLPPAELFLGLKRPEVSVAVVDTGFIGYPTTPWPTGRIVPASNRDEEPPWIDPDLSGHGIFVASTILQRRPESRVTVARAGVLPLADFEPDPAWPRADFWFDHVHQKEGTASDEIQLHLAVQRLIEADSADHPFAGLNVSMGTYVCDQLSHAGLAVRAAMARWLDASPKAPVVAAAGNHPIGESAPDGAFIPADLQLDPSALAALPPAAAKRLDLSSLDLLAVAALDRDGVTIAPYSNHRPHDVLAIGTDILAVRRSSMVTSWSGSSFATAVVTGAVVGGESPAGDTYDLGQVRLEP